MVGYLQRLLLCCGFTLLLAGSAAAQTTTMLGSVLDQNGQPLKGAVINLERTDIKGHYTVKSDKKGHWLYTGLPLGTFNITCSVDGKVVDQVNGVKSKFGDDTTVDFDLRKLKQQQQATAQANANGQLTPEQERGMSAAQKAKYEAELKQREEQIKKNKALDDAYNAGKTAIQAGDADTDPAKKAADYQTAVDQLTKASQMDANQPAVWDNLGEAYFDLGKAQTGDQKTKSFDAAIDAYQKSLAIKPDAGVYNQIGNIYGAERKIPEATEALTKAAQLDPSMAAKADFNMGANLVNSGQADKAAEFFKKATDADPTYAEAWFQYGSALMGKGAVDPKTGQQTYPPDTGTALQKYLELQPNGPHAQEATAMLQAMGQTVQTKVSTQAAKKKKQ